MIYKVAAALKDKVLMRRRIVHKAKQIFPRLLVILQAIKCSLKTINISMETHKKVKRQIPMEEVELHLWTTQMKMISGTRHPKAEQETMREVIQEVIIKDL
jgi:hypothetical protein